MKQACPKSSSMTCMHTKHIHHDKPKVNPRASKCVHTTMFVITLWQTCMVWLVVVAVVLVVMHGGGGPR